MSKEMQENSLPKSEETEEVTDRAPGASEDSEKQQEDRKEDSNPENKEEIETEQETTGEQEEDPVSKLEAELEASKDKYLRMYSEFENFRRRNAKERLELIKNANEELILRILPVIDDFERARKALKKDESHASALEGLKLIFNNLKNVLEQSGLKQMQVKEGSEFDVEYHEAISQIPAPKKSLKGKVVDVIEKGYFLNDKVIRFAKVVIGT